MKDAQKREAEYEDGAKLVATQAAAVTTPDIIKGDTTCVAFI